MHSDFYEISKACGSFEFLRDFRVAGHPDFYSFLHGHCDAFAKALHDRYGYRPESIWLGGSLIHAYCVAEIDDKIWFVDVRGATDDYEEFLEEFDLTGLDVSYIRGEASHLICRFLPIEATTHEYCCEADILLSSCERWDMNSKAFFSERRCSNE